MEKTRGGNATLMKLAQMFAGHPGQIVQDRLKHNSLLVDGQKSYALNFKSSKGNGFETDVLMADNDAFCVTAIRIGFTIYEPANPAIGVTQTYPNETYFGDETTATPAGTFNPKHLEAFYGNGRFSHAVGDTTYIRGIALESCRFVGEAQQSTAGNKSATVQDAGFLALRRPFLFRVTDNNTTKVEIMSNTVGALKLQYTTAANTGKKVHLITELAGYIITGGADFTRFQEAIEKKKVLL